MIEKLGGKLAGSRKMHFKEPEEDGLRAHHCTEVCEGIHEAFKRETITLYT
jgi:hypothetical protein